MIDVKIKKLHPFAVIPEYKTFGAAGMDITAISKNEENDRIIYGTGLAFQLPPDHFMMVVPRSSIAKKDLYLCNSCGILDEDYTGELKFYFRKDKTEFSMINSYEVGDRIGQIIIMPYPKVKFQEVLNLNETVRSDGGFGSTGF